MRRAEFQFQFCQYIHYLFRAKWKLQNRAFQTYKRTVLNWNEKTEMEWKNYIYIYGLIQLEWKFYTYSSPILCPLVRALYSLCFYKEGLGRYETNKESTSAEHTKVYIPYQYRDNELSKINFDPNPGRKIKRASRWCRKFYISHQMLDTCRLCKTFLQ